MFNVYPVIDYDSSKIIDISKRFFVRNIDAVNSKNIYFWYMIRNWKSPENIAHDFYGSCDYVWVILALNNIVNPFEDWILSEEELKSYIVSKYGSKAYNVHHYEYNGILYTSMPDTGDFKNIKTISNYEYEVSVNEKKRLIKILYPELLPDIEQEVKALFK